MHSILLPSCLQKSRHEFFELIYFESFLLKLVSRSDPKSDLIQSNMSHSRNRIIEHMVQVEFHNFPHLEFQNDRLWAQIYTQDKSYFNKFEPYCCARLRTNRFRGYIDVGDVCWRLSVLVTSFRCWTNIVGDRFHTLRKSPT